MATNLTLLINTGDEVVYGGTGANYITVDNVNDYFVWTNGSDDVQEGENEPTESELNQATVIISDTVDVQVPNCLLFDYSANLLYDVAGMGENKQYVFAFSFDGATANEPTLEAWDDSTHTTIDKHVLGGTTGYDSFVKAVATTLTLPGESWTGTPIAGDDVLELNHGNGALLDLDTGETSQELYANIQIVIPQSYPTPSIETFVWTVRFAWM